MFSNHTINPVDAGYSSFQLTVPSSTTKEDILNPANYRDIVRAFSDTSRKYFNPKDTIKIYAEDNSFYAEVLIAGVSRDELFPRLISFVTFKKAIKKEDQPEDFEILWDEKTKFTITRKSDKKMIKQGFACEEEALYYLKNIY